MKSKTIATTTPNGVDDNNDPDKPKYGNQLIPHPEPVGSEIFTDIVNDLQRYVFISEESAIKAAFWVAHAHRFKDYEYTPRLVITAPLKNCGKTILLSVLQAMTDHSLNGDNMTPSAYFRLANTGDFTFFLDEADQWFRKGKVGNDEIVAALNGGNQQRGNFWRSHGDDHEPKPYATHAAVALAGIQLERKLPDATLDRSILIQMQRARPGQLSQRFRSRKHLPIFQKHGERLLRWCNDNSSRLQSYRPNIPDEVDGREFNNWESLISIAEVASADWGKKLLHILLNQTPVLGDDVGIRLLQDCRRLYDISFRGDVGITPADLAVALGGLPDVDDPTYRTWARHHASKYREEQDARIKGRDICALLEPFGIKITSIRIQGKVTTGFKWTEDTTKTLSIIHAQETYAPMPDDYTGVYVPGEDREDGNGSWISGYDRHSEEISDHVSAI